LVVWDWFLVADVGQVSWGSLAQGDLQHRHDSLEAQLVQAFFEWLVLVNDLDEADFVHLMETLDSVSHELSELDSRFNGVGNTLDDDGVAGVLAVKELVCSLEVSSDSDDTSNSDFVSRERLLGLLNSLVCLSHSCSLFWL
jgi:hypothetical protein